MKRSRILIINMMLGFNDNGPVNIGEFSHMIILAIREHIKRMVLMMLSI
jgi:hypothetical protein